MQVGKTMQFQPKENLYVYFRYTDKHRVMCIVNPNDKATTLDLDFYKEGLAGKSEGKNIVTGNLVKFSNKLEMPAQSFQMIEL